MIPAPEWLPFAGSILVQLILFAFFAGGMRAELRALKTQIESLMDERLKSVRADGNLEGKLEVFSATSKTVALQETKIALMEQTLKEHDAKLAWGTRRFDEVFRHLSEIASGHLPHVLPLTDD